MNRSINQASPKDKKAVIKMIREDYENKGQSFAFDMVNAYNKNHILMIPYEHCNGCDNESPAIDNECLLCGQATQRLSDNDITIRGKKAIGFNSESEWKKSATDKDKARLEGFIIGVKFGLAAKF